MTTLPTPAGARRPGGRLHVDPDRPAVLRAEGEIDVDAVHTLAAGLGVDEVGAGRALAAAGVEEVDLSGATFIDSSALALLVSIAPHRRPDRLRVRGATGAPLMTLRVTGLDAVLDLVPAGA
ncbi:STAS domain-containing protein [Cellulomonas sp. ACRRI]|uniref:STAS domain-containing protein n=1 Tax=Cellulomonas sp. ACRRI TaxID=2918188 RepID=UPI001EF2D0E3|nr:STAS domain-containing protein [Cellulomonas sp. ACRRI]MCG7287505.1 STAS domain-containing protein [Cellulomonas sp. ACRRI]